MMRVVTEVLPSYYFGPFAEVLVTECGHRHVRPSGIRHVGDVMLCPFCEDFTPRSATAAPCDPKAEEKACTDEPTGV